MALRYLTSEDGEPVAFLDFADDPSWDVSEPAAALPCSSLEAVRIVGDAESGEGSGDREPRVPHPSSGDVGAARPEAADQLRAEEQSRLTYDSGLNPGRIHGTRNGA